MLLLCKVIEHEGFEYSGLFNLNGSRSFYFGGCLFFYKGGLYLYYGKGDNDP